MQWPDTDIVDQVGEGGVEVRSECELLTVLAFHHPGLLSQAAAAAAAVDADTREEWMSAPTRHLPFVPCQLQPRDVILQARQRVTQGERGEVKVEEYAKPRVTTNSSYGGKDGVNAGVPVAERVIELPRIQALARALAIIGTCDEGREKGEQALGRCRTWRTRNRPTGLPRATGRPVDPVFRV
eukprot:4664606-Pleurochrysis_carterae.AAC.1